MLKFFRSIRKSALYNHSFSRYILYAFGEIILVVLGILIALQVNNWNEQRKKDQDRKELVNSLISDFKATRQRIAFIENHFNDNINRTSKFLSLSYTDNKNVSVDSLQYYLSGAFNMLPFEPILTSYNQAVSTGNIGLIENKQFLDHISKFLANYSWHKQTVYLSGEIFYLGSIWEIRKEIGNLTSLAGKGRAFNGSRIIVSDAYKLTDEEFRNYIRRPEVFAAIDNFQTIFYNLKDNLIDMDDDAVQIIEELELMTR